MARDAKIIQRGIDEQSNDLAVPAGTMVDSKNLSFDRDGVAARRTGHQALWTGLPASAFDTLDPLEFGITRGEYDLFSGDVAFHLNQGLIFALDELGATPQWLSVPVNMPHMYRCHGNVDANTGLAYLTWNQLGLLLLANSASPFNWQVSDAVPALGAAAGGAVANLQSEATVTTAVQNAKFRTAFDTVTITAQTYISDDTSIRYDEGETILAGSITVAGSTNGTGSAARFSGASWMASNGSDLFVVDNVNQIRRVTVPAGVVTTLAGSTTAGDVDGVGTAARFRNISGICYSASTGFLYVSEGAAAHRIRRVDITTGSVTIYAGALTPTAGFTNATGTAARFNTPVGIEAVGANLYVGDTVNAAVRRISTVNAAVTTYAGSTTVSANGLVPGTLSSACLPSVTVRSVYLADASAHFAAASYLFLECVAPNSSSDVGFVRVGASDLSASEYVNHTVRCPSFIASSTSMPNKLDVFGVNAYVRQSVMAADTIGGAVFTTMEQPRVMDMYTRMNLTDPMPRIRALGITAPEVPSCTTTTGTTFGSSTAWAYRTLCGLKLPNGRIALGPPSDRVIVTTAGPVAGSVTAFPSPGLPYDGLPFVQVYRTRTTSPSTTDPGDTMFLCYEAPLTYGAGVVFTDSLPDDLLGAELYTNQYAFGAASASLPPPAFANEVAAFNQSCVLSNFNPAASCRIKVLGVSSLVSGTSTLTLSCFTSGVATGVLATLTVFLNSAATDPSIKRAQIASAGSAAQNAVQTARNIVRVINRCADALMFRAFYDESDPGSFVVYSVHPGLARNQTAGITPNISPVQAQVTFSTNASSAFATIALNNAQRQINAIAPSDQGDVDSFPIINQVSVGPGNEAILRTLPIAESLLVVKEDTIWRSDASYAMQIYETALSCNLPNSFARLNNQWIGLFNAGFRALTASQAVAIGRPIDRRVQNLYAAGSYFGGNDFASAATVDRQGVYLCAFNKSVFAFSAYGGGAWGTFEMPYVNQPSYFGAHKDAFIPIISDYPQAVFWQSDRRNNNVALFDRAYEAFFFDAKFEGLIASVTTGSDGFSSMEVTFASVTMPLGELAPSFAQAAFGLTGIISVYSRPILSGAGTSASPFVFYGGFGSSPVGASITICMPIEIMAQYAPSLAPGVNSQFGDVGVTLERAGPVAGSLTCEFYNRKDGLDLQDGSGAVDVYPYGQFSSSDGDSRQNELPTVRGLSGYDSYRYYDFQRFATPSERSQDQVLAIKLTNRQALTPLAIKGVVVELSEGGKVKQ